MNIRDLAQERLDSAREIARLRAEIEKLKTTVDVAIRMAMAWHPSENGPSYHEQLRELRAVLTATPPPRSAAG